MPSQISQTPLFQQSAESFTYDAVGNRLIGPSSPQASVTQNYTYDYENRIVRVTKQVTGDQNTDTITFKYDPFGRRIEKNVSTIESGTPTTYNYVYVYDNEDIILEILNKTQNGTTTTTTTAYTHGPRIDEPLSLERNGYYYHADGLGSITSITDSNQAVVNRYAYDSFGGLKKSETIRNAYTFTGREYDSETGHYFLRARYYDPEMGRFVSKDPIGFSGGDVNLYGYVFNNSVNLIDPFGEKYAELYGAYGAMIGGTLTAALSVVVDVVTGGVNVAATQGEIAAGASLGGAVGYAIGNFIDHGFIGGQTQDYAYPVTENPTSGSFCSKGGKQNIRDTELISVPVEEILKEYKNPNTPKDRKKRLEKELKARSKKNTKKRLK